MEKQALFALAEPPGSPFDLFTDLEKLVQEEEA